MQQRYVWNREKRADMTGRASTTARQVSDDQPTRLLRQERTPHVSAVPGEGAKQRTDRPQGATKPRSSQHTEMAAVVRWGSPGVQGAPTGFMVPHSPRKAGPLTRAVNDHQRPNSWVLSDCLVSRGTAFLRPGPPGYSNPAPWGPVCCPLPTLLATRPEEGADRGGLGSSPALRSPRSALSGPGPSRTGSAKQRAAVTERPLASRAPCERWPRGSVRPAAPSRKGRPRAPRPQSKSLPTPGVRGLEWNRLAERRAAAPPEARSGPRGDSDTSGKL